MDTKQSPAQRPVDPPAPKNKQPPSEQNQDNLLDLLRYMYCTLKNVTIPKIAYQGCRGEGVQEGGHKFEMHDCVVSIQLKKMYALLFYLHQSGVYGAYFCSQLLTLLACLSLSRWSNSLFEGRV